MTMLTLLFISVVLACGNTGVHGQYRQPTTLPPFVRPQLGPSPICCPPGGPKLAHPFECPRFQLAVGSDFKTFKKSCCQAECKCNPDTEYCCPRPSAEDPNACELSCQPKVIYRTCPRIEPRLDRDFFMTCRPSRNPCNGSCSEGQGCCRVDVGGKCQWACTAKVVWKPHGACPMVKSADRCPLTAVMPTCPGGCQEGQRCCRDVNGGCEWTCQEEIDPTLKDGSRPCPDDDADPDDITQSAYLSPRRRYRRPPFIRPRPTIRWIWPTYRPRPTMRTIRPTYRPRPTRTRPTMWA